MQLSLFDNEVAHEEITIPKSVKSPLELNSSVKSKAFRESQKAFSSYVHAIQQYHKCDWFEARALFFDHRDDQKPIKIKKEVILWDK